MELRKYLANLSYKYLGQWSKIANALKNHESVTDYPIEENYLAICDENYPEEFLKLRYPPWVIFYKGNIELLKLRKVAIVGSRVINDYAYDMTIKLANKLACDHCLVSGLALGVDGLVHQCGIEKGKTIGIIGSGLNYIYPKSNKVLYEKMIQDNLIISEYPCFVSVQKYHFPWRNRLIAALGECLYVTSAKIASGTMHTVNEAIELSKDIYCLPYDLYDPYGQGCNLLISQGANIILEDDLK